MNVNPTSQPVAYEDKPPAYEDVVTQQPTVNLGLQASGNAPPSAPGSQAGARGPATSDVGSPGNNENITRAQEERKRDRCSCLNSCADTFFWYLSCRFLLDCCVCFCNGLATCLDSFYDGCGNCCNKCCCGCCDDEIAGPNTGGNVIAGGNLGTVGNGGVLNRTLGTEVLQNSDIGESDIGNIDADISNGGSDIGDISVSDCDCGCFD